MSKQVKKHRSKKIFYILAIVIVLIAIAIAYQLWHNRKTTTASSGQTNHAVITATPSKPTQHVPTTNNSSNQGGIVDQNGQTSGALPPSSEWTSSSNGAITLQQPVQNQTISSGNVLSGIANVSQVQYILTDNSVGLISQGTLSVVNGKYSGKLVFTSHSSNGKLQVYAPNPSNGAEEDIINLNVSF